MKVKVTSVLADPSRHEVTVTCIGDYTITEADFIRLGIAESGECDTEKLSFCADKLACIKKSQSFLSYGDLSERKLREKLKDRFGTKVIDCVITLLTEKGYIDDEALSKRYAVLLAENRLWGRKKIEEYLYSKGFSRENSRNAVEEISEEEYTHNLHTVVEKNISKYDLADRKSYAKLTAMLYRSGYSWDEIRSVISQFDEE